MKTLKQFLSLISMKTKLSCAGVIALAAVSSILASIWPVRMGALYTNISNGTIRTITQGLTAVVTFGLIYLASECISILRRVLIDCIIANHEAEVREHSIEKLLKMPVSYYYECPSGEKTAQLNQGVAGFSQLIKILCNDVFATILTAVCTLVQVFLNAPGIMVAIMLLYLVVTVTVSVFQIRSQNGIREKIVGQKNELDGKICQSISNVEMIRCMNAERYERKRLRPSILNISHTEKRHHRYMGAFDCLKQLCKVSFQVILLVVSIVLIARGEMPAGAVITVCLLFQQLIKPIDEVYRFMDETASSVIKAKTLLEVSARPSDAVFDIPPHDAPPAGNEIRVEDLVITNPQKDTDIAWYSSVAIPCDRVVALQGPSGCGKTSLIRCLTRYFPYSRGKVELFGRDQSTFDQKELSEAIYYSPQTSLFFAGAVRDNLRFGLDRDVSDEELIHALRAVQLVDSDHNDTAIRKNPYEALQATISETAAELSGGMKQRLALARAFLRRPKLFIFDEITANLDAKATKVVLSNIEAYAKKIGAGIVYISHDENVVMRCDKIIQLRNKLKTQNTEKEVA